MPRCSFCGTSIKKGTGKIYVYASGKINNFCTMKCEKNLLKLGRKPLKVRWTEAYRKENKKESVKKKTEKKGDQK
ncbi:MAG: 50S ribosomal protein L24e [Parcubacteria group bacterium]|nr:50S ribosomal protein L24e [Parcubacteria group bacterium]|tara:strand:- start:954 stop:1178 length:225 start_codon:yes stop_codon:yes gene_type:complete